MTAYGATPEARQLRIRAGILLPFWEQRIADECGTGPKAIQRLSAVLLQGGSVRSALVEPDNEQLAPRVQIAGHWATFLEAPPEAPEPDEGEELAELIGRALPDHAPVESPGLLADYFRGALEAWLEARDPGVHIDFGTFEYDPDIVDPTADVMLSAPDVAKLKTIKLDSIPTEAWAAGESAVRALLEEVRAPLPSGPSQGGG